MCQSAHVLGGCCRQYSTSASYDRAAFRPFGYTTVTCCLLQKRSSHNKIASIPLRSPIRIHSVCAMTIPRERKREKRGSLHLTSTGQALCHTYSTEKRFTQISHILFAAHVDVMGFKVCCRWHCPSLSFFANFRCTLTVSSLPLLFVFVTFGSLSRLHKFQYN